MKSPLKDAEGIFVEKKKTIINTKGIKTPSDEEIQKLQDEEVKSANSDKSTQPIVDSSNKIIPKNRLIKASDATKSLTVHEWMIKSIIPSDGLIEVIGASGSYKSFVTLDMLFCISAGLDYHGHKTKQGTAIYVAGEGINGAKIRLRGLELHYGIGDYDLYILPMPSNLTDEGEIKTLAKEIKEISSDVSIVVFDTLHRNSAGADENSANDWAEILGNIDTHLKPVSKVVGWVHHTGITAGDRGRGTSSRYASIETQILIEKKESKRAYMTNTKQKDAEAFEGMIFEFEDIETGLVDEDGEEVTTLYPQRAEVTDKDKGKTCKLNKSHYDLVDSLRLSIKDKGQPISEEIKKREDITDGRMILVREWRDNALKIITSSGDDDEKKQHSAKMKTFKRRKDDLIYYKQIAEYDNFVYIVGDCTYKDKTKKSYSNIQAQKIGV